MPFNLKAPPDFGSDPLSQFIDNAWQNTIASYANLKTEYNLLNEIHKSFVKIGSNLNNTTEWIASLFLYRAHSSFLAGIRLSLSGQIPETYTILRSCIENSLYGFFISKNPNKFDIWINRHCDQKSENIVRNEFSAGKLFQCLKAENPNTHKISKKLYDYCIDFGAHPNERSITSILKMDESEKKLNYKLSYLTDDLLLLKSVIKSTAQVGVCALDNFSLVFKERFEILRISDKLNSFKKVL